MAQVITDRRDIDFVLYEQFNVEALTKHEKFADFNKKTFDLIIKEARNLAVKEILPTFAEGDREGVRLNDETITLRTIEGGMRQWPTTGTGCSLSEPRASP